MEQAGVVAIVGLAKQLTQPLVHVLAVQVAEQLAVVLDPSVLADAQEDETIDRALDREVQLALGQPRIPQRNVARKDAAPVLDLGQKGAVDFRGPLLHPVRRGELVEGAAEQAVLGKHAEDLVPAGFVVGVLEIDQPSH